MIVLMGCRSIDKLQLGNYLVNQYVWGEVARKGILFSQWQPTFSSSLGETKTRRILSSTVTAMLSTREETTTAYCYWKCTDYGKGCRALITTLDKQLTSPVPDHNHEFLNSELTVYRAKQNLKQQAADGDQPTKYLASEAVSGRA